MYLLELWVQNFNWKAKLIVHFIWETVEDEENIPKYIGKKH